MHRGVYAIGRRGLAKEGRWMAAVLSAGQGAVLVARYPGRPGWRQLHGDGAAVAEDLRTLLSPRPPPAGS